MKVLLYTHEFPPFQGGIATSAKRIADIVSSEYELMVCCPSYSTENRDETVGYPIKRIDFLGGKNFKKIPLLQYFLGLRKLKESINDFAPHKIVYLGEEAEIVGGLLNNKEIDQIVRIAGSGIESILNSKKFSKMVFKHFLKKLYKNAKSIVAVSKNTEKLMNKHPDYFSKEKIKLIYNGIDDEFINRNKDYGIRNSLNIKKDEFVLLTVARLLPRKGQDYVIKALSKISNTNIKYICVGEGRFLNDYKKLATSLKIEDRVIFIGGINRDIIHKYYDCADIFILCNRKWDSKIEGLPNVVIESMARSIPVIGSKNSGTEELILDGINGFLVDPYDTNSIRTKIMEAHQNRDKLDKMGESAKIFIEENFNYQRMRKDYLELITDE